MQYFLQKNFWNLYFCSQKKEQFKKAQKMILKQHFGGLRALEASIL